MRDARFSKLNKLNKCACPPMFAILGHWDTTSACKGTFLSFVQLIGEVGSLQAFPLHKPLRQCCCSFAHDIIWGHDCPCQNAIPTPATYFCWFWLLEAHSDNGRVEEGEERGCESHRFKLPNPPLMLCPKAAVLHFPPWAGWTEVPVWISSNLDCISLTLGHPFPWTHFLGRTQPILNN